MLIFVIGGGASGKSEFSENLATLLGNKKLYIATMMPYGTEANDRIQKHQKMRKDKGFETIECYYNLSQLNLSQNYNVIMLECMSNLVANEMYCENGNVSRIINDINNLSDYAENVIIVSNDVFCDGDNYSLETLKYIENIAEINIQIAKIADAVIEVVASIPIYHKGRDLIEKLN